MIYSVIQSVRFVSLYVFEIACLTYLILYSSNEMNEGLMTLTIFAVTLICLVCNYYYFHFSSKSLLLFAMFLTPKLTAPK